MISWIEPTFADSFSSASRRGETQNLSSQTTRVSSAGDPTSASTLTNSSALTSVSIRITNENRSATTVLESVSRSQRRLFSFAGSSRADTELTVRATHSVTWDQTFSRVSSQITNGTTQIGVGAPFINFVTGTVFISVTKATQHITTSTVTTQSYTLSKTATTTRSGSSWRSTVIDSSTFIVSSSSSIVGIRTTSATASTNKAATTTLTDTRFSESINNTIYQAQTNAQNSNNTREVLWVAGSGNSVSPYKPAISVATSTTRTTIFGPTDTIAILGTIRPPSISQFRQSFTNSSLTQSLSAATAIITNRPVNIALYQQFPPSTVTGNVSLHSSTATSYAFTNVASSVAVVDFSQSTTISQWFSSFIVLSFIFPQLNHQATTSSWQSRAATVTAQSTVVIDSLFRPTLSTSSSTTQQGLSSGATFSNEELYTFGAGGNTVKDVEGCTFSVSQNPPAPSMTVFYPIGAVVNTSKGLIITANVPFQNVDLAGNYTVFASKAPLFGGVTTAMPSTYSGVAFDENDEATLSATVEIYKEGISFTTKTSTETESGTAAFSASGETAYRQKVYASRLACQLESWAAEIPPGAYKVIDSGATNTVSTTGRVINAQTAESSWWHPISFVFPQTQSASAIIWTALRNITNMPPVS